MISFLECLWLLLLLYRGDSDESITSYQPKRRKVEEQEDVAEDEDSSGEDLGVASLTETGQDKSSKMEV